MTAPSPTVGELLDEFGVPRSFAEHRLEGNPGAAFAVAHPRPWYVQTAVALVIWVGALFFTSFLAATNVLDNAGADFVLGIGLLAVGAIGSRMKSGLLRLHVSLVAYAGSTSLLTVFGDRGLSLGEHAVMLFAAFLQVSALFVFDSRPVRFKATIGSSIALLAFLLSHDVPWALDAMIVGLVAAAALLWMEEARVQAGPLGRAMRPVGFGLVVAGLGAGFLSITSVELMSLGSPRAVTLALACVLLLVVLRAAREARVGRTSGAVLVAVLGVVAAALLGSDTPALLSAAIVIALGRLRKEPLLDGLGIVALAGFLVRTYYELDLSLLWTSFALACASGATLAARAFLLRGADDVGTRTTGSILSPVLLAPRRRGLVLLAPTLVVTLLVLGLVAHKEHQIESGAMVLLRLAPQDPRSLLQGDFMRLRYELASEVTSSAAEGDVVVRLDASRIATTALDEGEAKDGDVRIRWHRVRGQVVFGADSFFFGEGRGDQMAAARFVEVRVAADGTPVLMHLLAEDRAALSP